MRIAKLGGRRWLGLATLAALAAATPAYAGDTSATGKAQINESIQFALLLDMNFGTILANSTGGTVVLDAASPTRNCTGAGLVCTGAFSRSRLEITGTDAMVRVTYDAAFIMSGPGVDIPVQTTSTIAQNALFPLTGGSAVVDFGAILTVNPNQAPGTYSGVFSVNVNYE